MHHIALEAYHGRNARVPYGMLAHGQYFRAMVDLQTVLILQKSRF